MVDTSIHSTIFKFHNPHHLDFIDFDVHHPIRSILFHNYDIIESWDASGRSRPCILDHVQRSLLCNTVYLGCDYFECQNPHCDNFTAVHRHCHSRFCNSCGIKYAKQLSVKAAFFCLDTKHRHIVFTIPDRLRNWFRKDRSNLNLLFTAARNTISALVNASLIRKLKRKGIKLTHYALKNYRHINHFGMIATLHTFGRDLKWNPHIHALVPELIYSPDKDSFKFFTHFNFTKLRKTFQYELLRLIEEKIGPSFKHARSILYKDHPKGFYVHAKTQKKNEEFENKDHSDDINACITYNMRYAGRPCIAESRIVSYDKQTNIVHWYYHDHKDEKRYDVIESAVEFIKKLIIHIPDSHFRNIRYYGFYSNASRKELDHIHELLGIRKHKDYSKKTRQQKQQRKMNKLRYRTHLIDSFNRDPLKCKCGSIHMIRWREDTMTEHTEKSVLMKCKDCKYEEQVPEWVLEELALGDHGSGYEMCCPNCDGTMVEKSKYNKS